MSVGINDISIVMNARIQSSRIEKKLVRPFADTTLLKIAFDKLSSINHPHKYLAAREPEILSEWEQYSSEIGLISRSEESVLKGQNDYKISFDHYKRVPTKYIFFFNPCCVFCKASTYENAIKTFCEIQPKTMTPVIKRDNGFLYENTKKVNIDKYRASSHGNKPIYELAHVFHVFDKNFFMKKGYFWEYKKNNPYMFIIDRRECLDIDDLFDFRICEILYEKHFDPCSQ